MTFGILVLFALLSVAVVGGLAWGTLRTVQRQQERLAASNVVVPGMPTSAPVAWAGSHDPEARLHRRLRDAMTALRSAPAAMDGAGLDLRVELEQQALALDDALVAVAAALVAHRSQPLERITGAVEQLEQAVADVAAASADAAASRLEAVVADVHRQQVTLEEIRAQLDAPSTLDTLAAAPETTVAPAAAAPSGPAGPLSPPSPRDTPPPPAS
ncbi:hypothetical protein BH24ACT4_BH24ACT4_24460 [soil metagenome]